MKRPIFALALALLLAAPFARPTHGAVPHLISYQGKLVDAAGAPVPNGDYSVTFRIYDAPAGGALLWDEAQTVAVTSGLFTVLLGSVDPLTLPFDDDYYLALQVAGDAEMAPRQRLVSVGTSYRAETAEYALNADLLDGQDASAFLSAGSDYGRIGVAANLYEGTNTLTSRYVNIAGPDSVTGTGISPILRVKNNDGATGLSAASSDASSFFSLGIYGEGKNTSTGPAIGAWCKAMSSGTGDHFGLYAEGEGGSSSPVYAAYGIASNTSSGEAYGGFFTTDSAGTGAHYGVKSETYAHTTPPAYAIDTWAANTGTGEAYAGRFQTDMDGGGVHYGVSSQASADNSAAVYGVSVFATNYGSGSVYGGDFTTYFEGTGRHYGLRTVCDGSSSLSTYGTYSEGYNSSSGTVYGGYFYGVSGGSGTHYGVYGRETAGGTGAAVYASGDFSGSGGKYAVVRTSQGHRLLSVIESPEVWFEDFGEGELVDGRAHIDIDPLFLEMVTINAEHPMKVFVQLEDDCRGTYVRTSATGFDIHELQGGTSRAAFSYRVVAKRKGHEAERLRETDIGYDDPTLYPELASHEELRRSEERKRQEVRWQKYQEERQRRQHGKPIDLLPSPQDDIPRGGEVEPGLKD